MIDEKRLPLGQILLLLIMIAGLLLTILLNQSTATPQFKPHMLTYVAQIFTPTDVAFTYNDIYLQNLSMDSPIQLTDTQVQKCCLSWSPDGKSIAFATLTNNSPQFYIIDVNSGQINNFSLDTSINSALTWSPNGRTISFLSGNLFADGKRDLYLVDHDGANLRLLTANSYDAPSWSPDSSRLVFTSFRGGNQDVYMIDADGNNERQLTFSEATEYEPIWSPDGKWIIFKSDSNNNGQQIFKIDPDGGDIKFLYAGQENLFGLSWSPDGKQVAFVDGRHSNIYRMNLDGSNLQQLTFSFGNIYPIWSPDGEMLIFSSIDANGFSKVFLMNTDGTDLRQVSLDGAFGAVWKPK